MVEKITIEFFLQIFITGCGLGFLVGFLVFWFWLQSKWKEIKKEIDKG